MNQNRARWKRESWATIYETQLPIDVKQFQDKLLELVLNRFFH